MFDESLNVVLNIETKSLEDVKREIRQALERHARDDDEDYDNLKEMFTSDQSPDRSPTRGRDEATKSGGLLAYVIALTTHVPMLGKSCSGLVRSILKWYGLYHLSVTHV